MEVSTEEASALKPLNMVPAPREVQGSQPSELRTHEEQQPQAAPLPLIGITGGSWEHWGELPRHLQRMAATLAIEGVFVLPRGQRQPSLQAGCPPATPSAGAGQWVQRPLRLWEMEARLAAGPIHRLRPELFHPFPPRQRYITHPGQVRSLGELQERLQAIITELSHNRLFVLHPFQNLSRIIDYPLPCQGIASGIKLPPSEHPEHQHTKHNLWPLQSTAPLYEPLPKEQEEPAREKATFAGAGDRPSLKMCLISVRGIRARHGVAATTLPDLQRKARDLLPSQQPTEPVTLVLEEDGTIVDDEEYFLCLPPNTKFMVLAGNQTWSPTTLGGVGFTSSGSKESVAVPDEPDAATLPRWKQLAAQLKGDLSQIILLSEEDLQVLADMPCQELATEMADDPSKVQALQDTFQRLLDRREEERQSKELLQLYLEAVKAGGPGKPEDSGSAIEQATDEVDTRSCKAGSSDHLNHQIIRVLQEKSSPEFSLSNQQLEAVSNEDTGHLGQELSWRKPKVQALQEACRQELTRRLQQVQTLHSLKSVSQSKKAQAEEACRQEQPRRLQQVQTRRSLRSVSQSKKPQAEGLEQRPPSKRSK